MLSKKIEINQDIINFNLAFSKFRINKEKFTKNRTLNFKKAIVQKLITDYSKKIINQKFNINVDKEI
jgi:hypothetical protein